MKALSLLFFITFYNLDVLAQVPFVTTWKTTEGNEKITIPTTGGGYSYSVDWGDGDTTTNLTGDASHEYNTAGTYTISISGDFPRIFFNREGDTDKIQTIEQWGDIQWSSMELAFAGCSNLILNATDAPNLTLVTSLSNMFFSTDSFNGSLNNWDVSNITDMSGIFFGASVFNGDLNNWDVSNVTDMAGMFYFAPTFNRNISNWDVSKVTNMSSMFNGASSFNQDLSNWNVNNVTTMIRMFYNAASFNNNLNSWNVGMVTNMESMFDRTSLSPQNYDNTLIGWASLSSLQKDVSLGAESLIYCESEEARNKLISDLNWTILGDTKICKRTTVPFVTTWKTTTANESITLPFTGGTDYRVDWGDGSVTSDHSGYTSHTYTNAGTYRVEVSGIFSKIYFSGLGLEDRKEILTIEQWGDNQWINLESAFYGCENLVSNATDVPNLSNVTDMSFMFRNAFSFNGDLSQWDVGNVTNMQDMFYYARSFTGDLSSWNVSNVKNMRTMFFNAYSFNSDLSNWDVSNVIDMSGMFSLASSFNGNLSNWDVRNVSNLASMFYGAKSFQGDISKWDVSRVIDMFEMFAFADSFNGDLSNWDVSNVTQMSDMFLGAISFNRDLGNWDVSNVKFMGRMLNGTSLSPQNYDNTLDGWIALPSLQNNVEFGGKGLVFCKAKDARAKLITDFGWIVTEDREDCRFQRIYFKPIEDKVYGEQNFVLEANASSGLSVSFSSSNEDVVIINEDSVIIVGEGTTTVTASQEGNENYNPAEIVQHELVVLKSQVTSVKGNINRNVRIYPNPTSDIISVKHSETIQFIYLYNAEGRILDFFPIFSTDAQIEMYFYPPGLYYVQVNKGELIRIIRK